MTINNLLQNAKAVIFDMDGVLIDNKYFHDSAWIQFAKNHSTKPIENFDAWLSNQAGKTTEAILESLFGQKLPAEKIEAYSLAKEQLYRQLYSNKVTPVDGLPEFLNQLKKHSFPLAIATSGPIENVTFVIEALAIASYFKHIVHAGMLTHSKPHPEAYLIAARQLNINPEECLVFEDSLAGIHSARAAGMRVIGLATSLPQTELLQAGADMAFCSFSHCLAHHNVS